MDLLKDAYVQEKVEEAAKLFYTNDTVTVNLYWAAAAALLFFLRKLAGVLWSGLTLCVFSSHPTVGSLLPAFRIIRGRLRSSFYRVNLYWQPGVQSWCWFSQCLVTDHPRRATEPRHPHTEVPDIHTAARWVTRTTLSTSGFRGKIWKSCQTDLAVKKRNFYNFYFYWGQNALSSNYRISRKVN